MFSKEEELEKATMLINAQHCVGKQYVNENVSFWLTNATPEEIFLKGVEYAKNNPELIIDKIEAIGVNYTISDLELNSFINKDIVLGRIKANMKDQILQVVKDYIKIEEDLFTIDQFNHTYRASIRVVKNN